MNRSAGRRGARAPQIGYVNTGLTHYRKCKIYRGKNGLPRRFLQGLLEKSKLKGWQRSENNLSGASTTQKSIQTVVQVDMAAKRKRLLMLLFIICMPFALCCIDYASIAAFKRL